MEVKETMEEIDISKNDVGISQKQMGFISKKGIRGHAILIE